MRRKMKAASGSVQPETALRRQRYKSRFVLSRSHRKIVRSQVEPGYDTFF
jgi:hypothetical protein